jgi:Sigma-54 interaction domain
MGIPGVVFPDAQGFVRMGFAQANRHQDCERIIGNSLALMDTLDLVRSIASTDSTVLIEGETRTGKELIANAIQANCKMLLRDRSLCRSCAPASPKWQRYRSFAWVENKFKSTCRKCVWRMSVILTMHETTSARCYPMLQTGKLRRITHVKFSNE